MSILGDIKKLLGLGADNTSFDDELTILINGTIGELKTIGVPHPNSDFKMEADSEWSTYIQDAEGTELDLDQIKTLVFLNVKLDFDPPSTSFGITAVKDRIKKLSHTLQRQCDNS